MKKNAQSEYLIRISTILGFGLVNAHQKVFVDVSNRFGVTADGVNKAIALAR